MNWLVMLGAGAFLFISSLFGGMIGLFNHSISTASSTSTTAEPSATTSPTNGDQNQSLSTENIKAVQSFEWVPFATVASDTPEEAIVLQNSATIGIDSATLMVAADYIGTNFGFTPYARDKNHVYVFDFPNCALTGQFLILSGADPATFTPVLQVPGAIAGCGTSYAKDKGHVYFGDQVIGGADVSTFRPVIQMTDILDHDFSAYMKDSNHVYYAGQIIADADPQTFSIITSFEIATGTGSGASPTWYAKDSEHVYDQGQVVVGADPSSFTLFCGDGGEANYEYWCGYAKDKNHVYSNQPDTQGNWNFSLVESADPTTFTGSLTQ